ncbi:site-specific integrase [Stieleria sp. TO1_6]|uniref:tyrosine-type recombinase/integrase n=1 Tax=Stieleria tagensis TaxID=2956795 RepID=UPI00209AAA21|nr:site-specific integrase [Stieleria tagensis]MCO8124348.1 site-specific integrase [Stieleria tagensis]
MARPKAKAPARRYHISGKSVVTIAGRDFYLGPHDSPESIARYAALIAVYQQNGFSVPDGFELASLDPQVAMMLGGTVQPTQQADAPVLVRHLTASYREVAKTKYAGSHAEKHRIEQVCDELDKHDGDLQAIEYGPLKMQQQRQRWITSGKARVYCNRLTNLIIRIWKHAVSQELVTEPEWRRLKAVEPLREGQTAAPETEDVKPVAIEVVRSTAAELSPVLKAMVRIHAGTGMRPAELCRMRPCDIDRSGTEWIYRPEKHKTAKRGKKKAVPIVGDAREALTDYMNRPADAYCFSPRESVQWFRAKQAASRTTPKNQGNRPGTNRKANPKKQPGEQYTPTSYRQSIQRAAKRANVEHWTPYQLRHTAGTLIREALGVEAAQALLGHSRASMTEHYAKQTEAKAIEAAKVAPKL